MTTSAADLCRQMLAYGLGRTLLPSDDDLIEEMRRRLAASSFRFNTLLETIVASPQFLNRRGASTLTTRGP